MIFHWRPLDDRQRIWNMLTNYGYSFSSNMQCMTIKW